MSRTRIYYNAERKKHEELIGENFFSPSEGNGSLTESGHTHKFILSASVYNLYEPLREDAIRYFSDNGIGWWYGVGELPTGHTLSSQVACVNHLMLLRKDADAVLALINGVRNQFKKVLPIACDSDESYIAFEAVSDVDHLNEKRATRGSKCTSIDALVFAVDNNDETWLIPIEWKYTESYGDDPNKEADNKSYGSSGRTRMMRYTDLINKSAQLRSLDEYKDSIYYFEPFYQLMRQTLWAEQMIEHKDVERIKADHFLHIHIIPSADVDLLDKKYLLSGTGMEKTWRSMIVDQSKYVIVDPQNFMQPIKSVYPDLWEYLSKRYYS